jgi:hypothetical protein
MSAASFRRNSAGGVHKATDILIRSPNVGCNRARILCSTCHRGKPSVKLGFWLKRGAVVSRFRNGPNSGYAGPMARDDPQTLPRRAQSNEVFSLLKWGGSGVIAIGLAVAVLGGVFLADGVRSGQEASDIYGPTIFIAIGLAVAAFRSGFFVDKRRGVAGSWWGIGPWRRRTERSLQPFDRLQITRETRQSSSPGYHESYLLHLASDATDDFFVAERPDVIACQRLAARLGDFLGLEIHTAAGGDEAPAIHRPEDYDRSLAERLQRDDISALDEPPPTVRIQTEDRAGGVAIHVRVRPRGPLRVFVSLIPMLVLIPPAVFYFLPFIAEHRDPWAVEGPDGVAFRVLFVAGALYLLFALLLFAANWVRWERITVNRDALAYERRTLLRKSRQRIPLESIQHLEIVQERPTDSRSWVLRAHGQKRLFMARGEAEDTLAWLRDRIARAMAKSRA